MGAGEGRRGGDDGAWALGRADGAGRPSAGSDQLWTITQSPFEITLNRASARSGGRLMQP